MPSAAKDLHTLSDSGHGLKPVPFKKEFSSTAMARAPRARTLQILTWSMHQWLRSGLLLGMLGLVWLRRVFWSDFLALPVGSGLSFRGGIYAAEGEFRFVAVEQRSGGVVDFRRLDRTGFRLRKRARRQRRETFRIGPGLVLQLRHQITERGFGRLRSRRWVLDGRDRVQNQRLLQDELFCDHRRRIYHH